VSGDTKNIFNINDDVYLTIKTEELKILND